MKKKLLTSAAIASFLTAAGIVIPQTDIFAADTPNTPHPSTLPSAQPSNAPHPSTVPSEQPSTEPKPSAVSGGGNLLEVKDKKKVDSFADYWIEDINLDKNNILTIKTKDNARVDSVHYIDEENLPEQSDAPGAHLLQPTQSNGNVYRFDANKMVSGKDANKKFVLNEILLLGPKDNEDKHYILRKWYDANGKPEGAEGYGGGIFLDYKDLHKYNNKTRVVGPKATVESEPKLPEVGDKDYVVYTDKSQVELNGTIKTIVKYKPGVKKYSDVLFNKYIGKTDDGELAFENNFGKLKAPFGFDDGKNQDGKGVNLVSWHSMDKDGNDVFYLALKGVPVGHYHITQLFGLDLAKGNFDNADFTVVKDGKSVYRADKVEEPKVEQPKVEEPKAEKPRTEQPKVEEPKIVKPVEPTFPKVELPEKPKTKVKEHTVGDRKITVRFDSTKIPATNFYAEEVKDKDELAELTKELKAVNPKYKLVNVYDLKLIDSLGNTVDSVGSKRTVTLTNTKGKSVVYYVYRDQNNKLQLEKLPTYDGGNGNIVTFEAEHFSKYALVEEQTDGKEPEGPRAPQPAKPEGDKNTGSNWNPFAQGQKAKEGSTEVKSETGEVATKPVSNRKEGKALPNTGLQTTSYGFLAAIVGLFGAVALRRKNR